MVVGSFTADWNSTSIDINLKTTISQVKTLAAGETVWILSKREYANGGKNVLSRSDTQMGMMADLVNERVMFWISG